MNLKIIMLSERSQTPPQIAHTMIPFIQNYKKCKPCRDSRTSGMQRRLRKLPRRWRCSSHMGTVSQVCFIKLLNVNMCSSSVHFVLYRNSKPLCYASQCCGSTILQKRTNKHTEKQIRFVVTRGKGGGGGIGGYKLPVSR